MSNLPITFRKLTEDAFHYIPVSGRVLKLMYVNIYCALCHGQSDMMFWNVDFRTMSLTSYEELLSAHMELKKTGAKADFSLVYPRYRWHLYHPEAKPRLCKQDVSTCDTAYPISEHKTKCHEEPTSFVYSKHNATIYKNIHCAKCNYMTENDLTCIDPRLNLGTHIPLQLPPFSLLFDINSGRVLTRKEKSNKEMEILGVRYIEMSCKKSQVFDPFRSICVDLFCTGNTILSDGKCQDKHDQNKNITINSQNKYYLESDISYCPKLRVSKYKVNRISPDSIYLIDYNHFVNNSNFIEDGDEILVCLFYNSSGNYSEMHSFDPALSYLSLIGTLLSICGLLAQIITYSLFAALRNTPGKCLICLSTALLVSQALFLTIYAIKIQWLCVTVAIFMHFGFLAYFCWMTTLAFDIWRTFQSNQLHSTSNKVFRLYSIIGYGVPLIVVSIATGVNYMNYEKGPKYGEEICWICDTYGQLYYFIIPIGILLSLDLIFFGMTVKNICQQSQDSAMARVSSTNQCDTRQHVFFYIKLAIIMGVTWISGFLLHVTKVPALWYVFTIFNCIQGVWIFIGFVLTKKVFKLYTDLCGKTSCSPKTTENKKSGRSASVSSTKQTYLIANHTAESPCRV